MRVGRAGYIPRRQDGVVRSVRWESYRRLEMQTSEIKIPARIHAILAKGGRLSARVVEHIGCVILPEG